MAKVRDEDRAKRTLYVTGFNSKLITKSLLRELFTQGGPVVDVTLFETHAYILFQHQESVPYCLALFNEVELHGEKLRINPRFKLKDNYSYLNYLAKVRKRLMDEYMKMDPPDLPPKQRTTQKKPKSSQANRQQSINSQKPNNGNNNSKQTSSSSSSSSKMKRGRRNKTKIKIQKTDKRFI